METLHLLHPQTRLCTFFATPVRTKAVGEGGGGGLKLVGHQHQHPLRLKQGVSQWGKLTQRFARVCSSSSNITARVWGPGRICSSNTARVWGTGRICSSKTARVWGQGRICSSNAVRVWGQGRVCSSKTARVWGQGRICSSKTARVWGQGKICSSYQSSSGGGSSHVEDDDNDSNGTMEYLEVQVMDAVSMVPLHGKLLMTLANGREQEVDHINPSKGRLLYKASTPTMFLKVTDGSDLMLPIVVGEGAVTMLMRALHDEEHFGRPSCYHLMKEMVGALNYEARMVRITERVVDTYYARIFLGKKGEAEEEDDGDEEAMLSVDARPSDAINFAVRCKVPIFVNRRIITADAVRPVVEESGGGAAVSKGFRLRGSGPSFWEVAAGEADSFAAEEAALVMNMLVAAAEERYAHAAHWRDELGRLRKSRKEKL